MIESNYVEISVFERIISTFNDELNELVALLANVIHLKVSLKCGHFTVNDGIHQLLDEKKQQMRDLPNILPRMAQADLLNFNGVLTDCTCIYQPQIGLLLESLEIQLEGKQQLDSNQKTPSSPPEIEGLRFTFHHFSYLLSCFYLFLTFNNIFLFIKHLIHLLNIH